MRSESTADVTTDVTADVTSQPDVVIEESDRVNLKRTIGLPTAVAIIVGGIIGRVY